LGPRTILKSPPPVNKASSQRRIDWRQPVVSDPVEVCTEAEKIIRRPALSTVARTPERLVTSSGVGVVGLAKYPSTRDISPNAAALDQQTMIEKKGRGSRALSFLTRLA